ncbi:MAG TPA: adenylate/guanylate cyclase domain-containing protein [Xanthobacteraceae bacterium]|jgi:adenylate cyclase|nr:adenylate/guanylate cyclase domain-containing protein [Xanthobacteraceae bacterium]
MPAAERINRKLAAILAADVVGYSRMMAADEAGTLAALKRHRETVFDPAVAAHKGRVVKLIGDGTIVEFASVIDAVNCALSVQRPAEHAPDQRASQAAIVLRIGINLGDVIMEGDDLYGDGVNIAARLEPLAEPGGICISSIVNESIGNRIDVRFQDGGDITVKNIDRPIRVWRWHPSITAVPSPSIAPNPGPNGAGQSIAVLPFTNMSGDPEQEYFSDGISEDIITDLSKIAGLTVIARNSSFTYKGRSVDVREIGRELGVRSVLEGSIRRAGQRVRITAQLIDATSGSHLWAERYDRDLTDIFAVQDEVTTQIVGALKVTLSPAEKARLVEKEPSNIAAYDCVLRGREIMLGKDKNRETFVEAVTYFKKALELDANYSQAYASLGFAHMFDYQNRWSDDPDKSLKLAREYAQKAIDNDPNEPMAHGAAALTAIFEKDFDRAQAEVDRTLALNPSSALAHNLLGTIRSYSGRPLEAIPAIEQAMRLDPAFRPQFLHFLGIAYLLAGKYETAAAMLRQRILLVPNTDFSRAVLAATLGHLGEIEEARRVWAELMKINPKFSFSAYIGRQPMRPEDAERVVAGLAKTGLS